MGFESLSLSVGKFYDDATARRTYIARLALECDGKPMPLSFGLVGLRRSAIDAKEEALGWAVSHLDACEGPSLLESIQSGMSGRHGFKRAISPSAQ